MALSQRVKRNVQRSGVAIVAAIVLALTCSAVVFASNAKATSSGTDYGGPYTTMKVPSVCAFPQTDLRYYNDLAPSGSTSVRSGAHGHGGYLKCIYIAVDGPLSGTDHHYGKWLVFVSNGGKGLLIPLSGIEATYFNCALPGFHFPYPPGNGQPNDCGESWLPSDTGTWLYQDNTAGDLGKPMTPSANN
jgi:hypothetical protein